MSLAKNKKLFFLLVVISFLYTSVNSQIPQNYKGKPFNDSNYKSGPQVIPGRIELAYYDLGGEGVAYHDVTPENEGSKLNHEVHDYGSHLRPGISPYIAFFREKEGVDISYTKDWVDFNHPNKVDPKVNQLYLGWESDGEWTNYTVDIKAPGKYRIVTVYGNEDNHSSLWLNNQKLTDLVLPENTGNWHYWNQATIGEVTFTETGLNLLTLKYNKGSNLAYLDFIRVEENKDSNTNAMTKKTSKEQIEAIISTVEKLIPEYQKKPENPWSDGNVAICIIDEQGNLYGKLYGSNKVKTRGTFKIAWIKASQVWITGLKTGEFEKKIFNGELKEDDFGIQAPDFIGWPGGQPIVLKDGTKLSVGFSGFSGANDLGIVQRAIQELGI